jgi:hypothetical protein
MRLGLCSTHLLHQSNFWMLNNLDALLGTMIQRIQIYPAKLKKQVVCKKKSRFLCRNSYKLFKGKCR